MNQFQLYKKFLEIMQKDKSHGSKEKVDFKEFA